MSEPHRKRMRRVDAVGTARFLTFSCFHRLPLFNNDRIKDRFVEHLTTCVDRHDLQTLAWVVMPEHVHLIVYSPDARPLTAFLTTLKRSIAVEVINRWRSLGASVLSRITDGKGAARFWQPGGGYDRNVVGDELVEKIRYVHANPIQRGLSAGSTDWKWSSARRYANDPDAAGPPIAFDCVPPYAESLI